MLVWRWATRRIIQKKKKIAFEFREEIIHNKTMTSFPQSHEIKRELIKYQLQLQLQPTIN